MINSKFSLKEGRIHEIKISGHANFKTKGQDIVCAAISTAILVTANAIIKLELDHTVNQVIEEGYFNLVVKEFNPIVEKLLLNLEYTFIELQNDYKKYLKYQKEG
jgi:uncharacterized protein